VQPDGLHEQAVSTDATVAVTGDQLLSSDTGTAGIAKTAAGPLLVAHENATVGAARDTTTVQSLSSNVAQPTTVASLPAEELISLVTNDGQTYLLTRLLSDAGVLDPPVRIRHWNGLAFDALYTLPIPGPGDDQKFSLAVDGSGRLHAFWVGSRESCRLWHSVSTNAANPHGLVVNGTAVVLGHVKPAVSGYPVQIQRKVGSRWVTAMTVNESSNGHYKTAVHLTKVGTYSFRAFVTGCADVRPCSEPGPTRHRPRHAAEALTTLRTSSPACW
jgi:hypothetical protein